MLSNAIRATTRLTCALAVVFAIAARASPAHAACPSAATRCATAEARWQPASNIDWTIDHSTRFADGRLDMRAHDVYVLPLHVVEQAEAKALERKAPSPVSELTCRNRKTLVCYSNCGAYEPGHWNEELLTPVRDKLLGGAMAGYPDERWLDISQLDAMRGLVRDKLAKAARLGCDAFVCDNTEAWITGTDGDGPRALQAYRSGGIAALKLIAAESVRRRTGLDIGYEDQLRFNRMIAGEAHAQCMAAGLINDVFQIDELAGSYDFALNEQCHHCGWCDLYEPFARSGKPVLHLEFADNEGFCGPGSEPIEKVCAANGSAARKTFNTVRRAASSKLHLPEAAQTCR